MPKPMNSDDFHARYRLLKCVAVADGIRTHNAQETTTGKVVMVHLLDDAGPDDVDRLRGTLSRMSFADRSRVLETATLPAGFAVVTDFLPGMVSFPAWIAARVAPDEMPNAVAVPNGGPVAPPGPMSEPPPPAPVPLAAAPPVAPSHEELPGQEGDTQAVGFSVGGPSAEGAPSGGEFTRLFVVGGKVQAESLPARPTPSEPIAPPAPVAPPAPKQPGEFTRMFAQAAPVAPVVPPPAAQAPAPPPPVIAELPLLPPLPPPVFVPPPPPPPTAPPLSPGEFTRMFNPPAVPNPSGAGNSPFVPTPAPGLPPMPAAPSSLAGPTAQPPSASPMLGAYPPPPVSPMASGGAFPSGGATGAMEARSASPAQRPPDSLAAFATPPMPVAATPQPPSSLPPLPPLPPLSGMPPLPPLPNAPGTPQGLSPLMGGGSAPSTAAGAGDYTRMIRQSVTPAPPPATPAPAKAPPPPKRGLPIGLVIAISAVVVLTAVLILYFLFRPVPPTAIPGKLPAVPNAPTAPAVTPPAVTPPTVTPPAR
jgi:hypothetical protein